MEEEVAPQHETENNNIQLSRVEILENKMRNKMQTKLYKRNLKNFILTSRFNNHTWNENANYRKKNRKLGCVYCAPTPISSEIPMDSILFILEMNNDTNRIMGIGMVRNHPVCNKYYVYENENYNRYVYVGKYRIDRDDMSEEEDTIMKVFDILCFTGNKHMKRGHGLKSFPIDMLFRCSKIMDLVDFINEMFKKRITKNQNKNSL
jgi:hypothetical protein